jgi:hypothetical protein
MFGPFATCWPLGQNIDVFDKTLAPWGETEGFGAQGSVFSGKTNKKPRGNFRYLAVLTLCCGPLRPRAPTRSVGR